MSEKTNEASAIPLKSYAEIFQHGEHEYNVMEAY